MWLFFACRQTLSSEVSTIRPGRLWNDTLKHVVDPHGDINYDELQHRRAALDGFVHWLAEPKPRQKKIKKADRHAFWINAYNALVLFQILERDVHSVTDVHGWLPLDGSGFFVETDFWVDGQKISLAEIRDERLRLRKYDPRDHSALYDGTESGPPLRATLYSERSIDSALDASMRRFVNDPERGVSVSSGVALFPPVFREFPTDFSHFTTAPNLCEYAIPFADPPLARQLLDASSAGCKVRFRPRRWTRNHAH